MSLSNHFERLGAPLKSVRWSWGAIREDGAVVLRVWQDQWRKIDGTIYYRATFKTKYADDPENLGHQERLEHVAMVEQGAKCYLVMCLAKDTDAIPRTIKSFNKERVFVGGELKEGEGDLWIERGESISASELFA